MTESQERTGRETTVGQEAIQEVDPVVQNADLPAGIDAGEIGIEIAVEDTSLVLTEMIARIGTETEIGIGIGKGIGTGIGTAIVIGIETAEEIGIEIGTRIADGGTAVGPVAAGRGAHPAPHTAHAPGPGRGPRPDPAPGARGTATGTPRHPRPTGRLVRSRQGTDARTEQLPQG